MLGSRADIKLRSDHPDPMTRPSARKRQSGRVLLDDFGEVIEACTEYLCFLHGGEAL